VNYSRNLEAQPAAFMEEDDDSGDDIGTNPALNFDQDDSDSDEKEETELMDTNENSDGVIDLLDLDSGT